MIPQEPFVDEHDGLPRERLRRCGQKARDAGLYAPQLAQEWGGLGLDMRGMCVVFEAAGRSLLGPLALNCAAPDEGNMHLLELVATARAEGALSAPAGRRATIRSCFAMTEPPPGAGSDPTMLRTRAERDGDGWVINGDKWFITGADGAAFAICMAVDRRRDAPTGAPGATMFLVDAGQPRLHIVRQIPSLDSGGRAGTARSSSATARGDEAVLGEVGEGFTLCAGAAGAGAADALHALARRGAARAGDRGRLRPRARRASASRSASTSMVQAMLADSAIELHAARLMIWHAAWMLDQGGQARHETSMARSTCPRRSTA